MDLTVGQKVEPYPSQTEGDWQRGSAPSAAAVCSGDESVDLYSEFMLENASKQCSTLLIQSRPSTRARPRETCESKTAPSFTVRPPDEDSNLDLYTETLCEELQERQDSHMEVLERCEVAEARIVVLEKELRDLKEDAEELHKAKIVIQNNMSSLLLTARTELKRKDDEIQRLRLALSKGISNSSHHMGYLQSSRESSPSRSKIGRIWTNGMKSSASTSGKTPISKLDPSTGSKRKRYEPLTDTPQKRSRGRDSKSSISDREPKQICDRKTPERRSTPFQSHGKTDRHGKSTSDSHRKTKDKSDHGHESDRTGEQRSKSRHSSGKSDSGNKKCEENYGILDLREILRRKKKSNNSSCATSDRDLDVNQNRSSPKERYHSEPGKIDDHRLAKKLRQSTEFKDSLSSNKVLSASEIKADCVSETGSEAGGSSCERVIVTNPSDGQISTVQTHLEIQRKPMYYQHEVLDNEAGERPVMYQQSYHTNTTKQGNLSVNPTSPNMADSALVCANESSSNATMETASTTSATNHLLVAPPVKPCSDHADSFLESEICQGSERIPSRNELDCVSTEQPVALKDNSGVNSPARSEQDRPAVCVPCVRGSVVREVRRIKLTTICGKQDLTLSKEKTHDVLDPVIQNIVTRENTSFANAKVVHIDTSPDNDSGDSRSGWFSESSTRKPISADTAQTVANAMTTIDKSTTSISVPAPNCHNGKDAITERTQLETDLKQPSDLPSPPRSRPSIPPNDNHPNCLNDPLSNDVVRKHLVCDYSFMSSGDSLSHDSVGKGSVCDSNMMSLPSNASSDKSPEKEKIHFCVEENEHLLLCTVNPHPDSSSMSVMSEFQPESIGSDLSDTKCPSALILKEEVCSRTIPYVFKVKHLDIHFPLSSNSLRKESIPKTSPQLKKSKKRRKSVVSECWSTEEEQISVTLESDVDKNGKLSLYSTSLTMPSQECAQVSNGNGKSNQPLLSKIELVNVSDIVNGVDDKEQCTDDLPNCTDSGGEEMCIVSTEMRTNVTTDTSSTCRPHHHKSFPEMESCSKPIFVPVINACLNELERPYKVETFEFTSFPTHYANLLNLKGEFTCRPKQSDVSEPDKQDSPLNNRLEMSVSDDKDLKANVSELQEPYLDPIVGNGHGIDVEMEDVSIKNVTALRLKETNLETESEAESENMDTLLPCSGMPADVRNILGTACSLPEVSLELRPVVSNMNPAHPGSARKPESMKATNERSSCDSPAVEPETGRRLVLSVVGLTSPAVLCAVSKPVKPDIVALQNKDTALALVKCKENTDIDQRDIFSTSDVVKVEHLSNKQSSHSELQGNFSPNVVMTLGDDKLLSMHVAIEPNQPVDLSVKTGQIGQSVNTVLQVPLHACRDLTGFNISEDGALDLSRKTNLSEVSTNDDPGDSRDQGHLCSASPKLVTRQISIACDNTRTEGPSSPLCYTNDSHTSLLQNKVVCVQAASDSGAKMESQCVHKRVARTGTRDVTVSMTVVSELDSLNSFGVSPVTSASLQHYASNGDIPDTPQEPHDVSISSMEPSSSVDLSSRSPSSASQCTGLHEDTGFHEDRISPVPHVGIDVDVSPQIDSARGVSSSQCPATAEASPELSKTITPLTGQSRSPASSGQSSSASDNEREMTSDDGSVCVRECATRDSHMIRPCKSMTRLFPEGNSETLKDDLNLSDDNSIDDNSEDGILTTTIFKLPDMSTSAFAKLASHSPRVCELKSPEKLVLSSSCFYDEHNSLSLYADGCDFDHDLDDGSSHMGLGLTGTVSQSLPKTPEHRQPVENKKHRRKQSHDERKEVDNSIEDGEVTSDGEDATADAHNEVSLDMSELFKEKELLEEQIKDTRDGQEPLSSTNGRDGHSSERHRPSRRHDRMADRHIKDYRAREDHKIQLGFSERERFTRESNSSDRGRLSREIYAVDPPIDIRARHRYDKDEPRHGHHRDHSPSTRRITLNDRRDRHRPSPPVSANGSYHDHSKENHGRSDFDRSEKYSIRTRRRDGPGTESARHRRDSHSCNRRSSRDVRS